MGYFKNIYDNKSILWSLITKNLKGQYKSSYLGFIWQFIIPSVTVLLFYVVFTSLRINTMTDYWIFLCAGIFPFEFFNRMIHSGSMVIVSNSSIVKKMYFPREIIALSFVISALIIFLISYAIIFVLILISGHQIDIIAMLTLIPLTVISFIFAYGLVLLLSSITVYVRDFAHFINAFSRALFWVTPVFYTVDSLNGILAKLIWINPLTSFMVCFQDIVYYASVPSIQTMFLCLALAIGFLICGILCFNKLNRGFVERL